VAKPFDKMPMARGRVSARNAALRKIKAKNRVMRLNRDENDKTLVATKIKDEAELEALALEALLLQENRRKPSSTWGLFACSSEPVQSCGVCLCCPCYYASTRAVLNPSGVCSGHFLGELLKLVLCCPLAMGYSAPRERAQFRRHLNLPAECGTASGDHVAWWFLPCCALCEEEREMRSRKACTSEGLTKRAHEAWVESNTRVGLLQSSTPHASAVTVEDSKNIHRSSGVPQCHECCCFCAPDPVVLYEEEFVLGFEFKEMMAPVWVARSMAAHSTPSRGEEGEPRYCRNCGDVAATGIGDKLFCTGCGQPL